MNSQKKTSKKKALIHEIYTKKNQSVERFVVWVKKKVELKKENEEILFSQNDVEVPEFWSDFATEILASKYFRKNKETSLKQVVRRIVKSISKEGRKQKVLSLQEQKVFEKELSYILIHQIAAFNSPVFFNVGVQKKPQSSACFIQSLEDELSDVFDLLKNEALIFKYGSGSGTNFSNLRGKGEKLSRGGEASGLLAYLDVYDRAARATKSGGTTRRAAKMVCLDHDHPDLLDFIDWKKKEEKKAKDLISLGYDSHFEGEAYLTVSGQNANHSVRLPDSFFDLVKKNGSYVLLYRTTKKAKQRVNAKEVLDRISEAAWECADPGVHFVDQMEKWNPCKKSGQIRATNPCSEFVFLDDTACNLASLNLSKFIGENGEFLEEEFEGVVRLLLTAQEILVGMSSYPTEKIQKNSYALRPLGLGFTNLGGALMKKAMPYDSEEARDFAALVSMKMTYYSYDQSQRLAQKLGSFREFTKNKKSFLEVLNLHKKESEKRFRDTEWKKKWDDLLKRVSKTGVRNAQVTLLAPTGTIGLLMDCETTGVEPEFSLTRVKKLSGGGFRVLVNPLVKSVLEKLGYEKKEVDEISSYVLTHGSVIGSKIKKEHESLFSCANDPKDNTISMDGHLQMMASIQPFLSGAISKTVNLPNQATVRDVQDVYLKAFQWGLKCISVYRDGSKASQPLTSTKKEKCEVCGFEETILTGSCRKCMSCGTTTGCG